jgi:hypothetical protein
MWHVQGTGVVHAGVWWVDLTERDHLEDRDVDGRLIPKSIPTRHRMGAWTVLLWLRIWTSGGLL